MQPINLLVYEEPLPRTLRSKQRYLILRLASRLDAFSAYPFRTWLPSHYPWQDNWNTRGPYLPVLSYWGDLPFKYHTPTPDRDRTVSRRSKPSSRTLLTGEQPDPWDLVQPQDRVSRHRGAKQRCRYELSSAISLLSPEYLLSVERRQSHDQPPDHLALLSYLLVLSDSQLSSLMPMHSKDDCQPS